MMVHMVVSCCVVDSYLPTDQADGERRGTGRGEKSGEQSDVL